MSEKKTKHTRYRLEYYKSGIIYEPVYRKKLETVERLAHEKLCHEDYFQPTKAMISVCHTYPSRGRTSWIPVKTITKEEAIRDAARSSS